MTNKIELPDTDDTIRRYLAGESAKQLSIELGVSANVIYRIFKERGVKMRSRSERERAKWKRMDRAAVERQCSAAWRAATGRKKTLAERIKAAKSIEGKIRATEGKYELEIFDLLHGLGERPSWQTAVGPYNVDLSICEARVAVEIQRDQTRRKRPTSLSPERLEYILDAGWSVLVVFGPKIRRKETLVPSLVADKISAFCDVIRRQPAPASQYGVITGDAKPFPTERFDLDGRPRIRGF